MTFKYAALPDLVCLDVGGTDAGDFLHAQLARSIADLDANDAPLAGWSDARGRVRALVRVCRLADRWLLATPREGADDLARKLKMFVLRAKVTITVADSSAAALLGDDAPWLTRQGIAPDTPPNQTVRRGDVSFIRVGPSYWQLLGARAPVAALAAGLDATSDADAALAEIGLGIPAVTPAIADRYVAQMLNLDELGALSFDKGCYPGQEIIARVHNLGDVKRRARRYALLGTTPPKLGTPVTADGAEVGEVVRSAATESASEVLAVVDGSAAGSPLECVGSALRELPLPFAVPRA